MALIRWQPFSELDTLRRQMDRLFDEIVESDTRDYTLNWKPAIQLQDIDENIILRAEIPGVEGKDIDIHVSREAVVITGERRYQKKADVGGYFRSEFRYGKFQRVISLPVAVQNDRVKAEFNNGILTLTLPKVTEAQRKVVKINLADTKAESTDSASNADAAEPAASLE